MGREAILCPKPYQVSEELPTAAPSESIVAAPAHGSCINPSIHFESYSRIRGSHFLTKEIRKQNYSFFNIVVLSNPSAVLLLFLYAILYLRFSNIREAFWKSFMHMGGILFDAFINKFKQKNFLGDTYSLMKEMYHSFYN